MQKTHTADEATPDGETPSQDWIYVSNARLKFLTKPNKLCDQLLKVILSTYTPPSSTPCQPQLALATPWIGRERSRKRERERER